MKDLGRGNERVGVKTPLASIAEIIEHATVWKIRRFKNDADFKAGKVYSKQEAKRLFGADQFTQIDGNVLCNEGINELWELVCAATATRYDNTNANLIVGTGSGGATAGDTEATFTAGVKKVMDGGYPTYGTSQKAVWRATYVSGDANQAWNEFGTLNAASSGLLLNRKVSAEGTKVVGQTWELTLEITLS